MATREVTCMKKHQHYSPHERIQAIGGAEWKHLEVDAIRRIETGTEEPEMMTGLTRLSPWRRDDAQYHR